MSEKTIFKFTLPVKDFVTLLMPKGAEIISVQIQGRSLCAWAIVDSVQPLEKRRFSIVGTGHAMPKGNLKFLGTVQIEAVLVFHVFEIIN